MKRSTVDTAAVFMHRFYMYREVTGLPRLPLVIAFLFLTDKVRADTRKQVKTLEGLLRAALVVMKTHQYNDDTNNNNNNCELSFTTNDEWNAEFGALLYNFNGDSSGKDFQSLKTLVEVYETEIAITLGFKLTYIHPNLYIQRLYEVLGGDKRMYSYACSLASTSLQLSDLGLYHPPSFVALVCINIAAIHNGVEFVTTQDQTLEWFQLFDHQLQAETLQEVTMELLTSLRDCACLSSWMTFLAPRPQQQHKSREESKHRRPKVQSGVFGSNKYIASLPSTKSGQRKRSLPSISSGSDDFDLIEHNRTFVITSTSSSDARLFDGRNKENISVPLVGPDEGEGDDARLGKRRKVLDRQTSDEREKMDCNNKQSRVFTDEKHKRTSGSKENISQDTNHRQKGSRTYKSDQTEVGQQNTCILNDVKPKDARPKDVRPKDARPKYVRPIDYVGLKDVRPNEARPKDARTKDARPKDTKPKYVRPIDYVGLKDVRPKDVRPKDVRPIDYVGLKDVRPNDARPKDARPKDVRPKDVLRFIL